MMASDQCARLRQSALEKTSQVAGLPEAVAQGERGRCLRALHQWLG